MSEKKRIQIEPNPDNVLIKLSKEAWQKLFYKDIRNSKGDKVKLVTAIEADEEFDKRFSQHLSTGEVVAVGINVKNVLPGDIAIIDYIVTNREDDLVAYINGDKLVCIKADTTYHTEDAPWHNGKRAYVVGDYDHLSKLLGVVRNDKLISFAPYVFLENKKSIIMQVNENGVLVKNTDEYLTKRSISMPKGSPFKLTDKLVFKEVDHFPMVIGNREICVVHQEDIKYSLKKKQ